MKIKVKPEGREGIFTVEKKDIIEWLKQYPEDEIHNFSPLSNIAIGAGWDKEDVIETIESSNRIAILTGKHKRSNLNHALSVVTSVRLDMFDIGDITLDDLEIITDKGDGND